MSHCYDGTHRLKANRSYRTKAKKPSVRQPWGAAKEIPVPVTETVTLRVSIVDNGIKTTRTATVTPKLMFERAVAVPLTKFGVDNQDHDEIVISIGDQGEAYHHNEIIITRNSMPNMVDPECGGDVFGARDGRAYVLNLNSDLVPMVLIMVNA